MTSESGVARPSNPIDSCLYVELVTMEASSSPWTVVARLLRPQGRRGELLAEPLSDLPGLFTAGRRVAIAGVEGSASLLETTLEDHWLPVGRNAGRVVLRLAASHDIAGAERLARHDLLIPTSDLPALEADTWYVRDLLGCALYDGETFVGEIANVQYPLASDGKTRLSDAAPWLEINVASASSAEGRDPVLVPFIRAWLDDVNLKQRRVTMHLPRGLVTFDGDSL